MASCQNREGSMSIDTQLQAYAEIQSKAAALRIKVKRALREHGALTSEEIADKTHEDYKSIQPRTSELHESLEIFDTGQRRKNESGKKAIVWCVVENDDQKQLAIKQTLKKEKPCGNAYLWGKMRQAQYAYAALQSDENAKELHERTMKWCLYEAENIRKTKFSDKNVSAE